VAEIVISDLEVGYIELAEAVMSWGKTVSPRGMETKEIRDMTVILRDPQRAFPIMTGRNAREGIAAAEAMQLLGGISDLQQLKSVAKTFGMFSDDGLTLRGAYGPRVYSQVQNVVKSLTLDKDSRQAAAVIWRPDEISGASRDVPCTVYLSWNIRNGALNAKTHMRSNDLWLGVPYDFFAFTRLQYAIASALDLPVGEYVHHVDSFHLYATDFEKVARLAVDSNTFRPTPLPWLSARAAASQEQPLVTYNETDSADFAVSYDYESLKVITASNTFTRMDQDPISSVTRITNLQTTAVKLARGQYPLPAAEPDDAYRAERWFAEALAPHVTEGRLCDTCRYVLPPWCFEYRSGPCRRCK